MSASGNDARLHGRPWLRISLLLAVVAAAAGLWWLLRDQLTLAALAQRESALRAFQTAHPVIVYGAAFLAYVLATGLSLPGAAVMTLVLGWYFGFWRALVLVSFASTSGATLAFLLSRYLVRDIVQSRLGDRLAQFNQALEREGAYYLFTLRLIPVVPFFVINLAMGLTAIRTRTFWWVSQLGMLPGTAVYVYAGSQVPDLKTLAARGAAGILSPTVLIAFAVLGLFPLIVKKVLSFVRPPRAQQP